MTVSVGGVTVDCRDAATVARFCSAALDLPLDPDPSAAHADEVARLVELGATHLADKEEWGHSWAVLTDPEGNEFCLAARS